MSDAADKFHEHLDECERCRTQIFNLTAALRTPVTTEEAIAFGLPSECGDPDTIGAIQRIYANRAREKPKSKHTCQLSEPNSMVPYSDGPCMECAKERGAATGINDGPPNSIIRYSRRSSHE
jgi:hypothetical protein